LKKILKLKLFLAIFVLTVFLFPGELFSEIWLKVDIPEEEQTWIDTSHWENRPVWVETGYCKDTLRREWVDNSYTVNRGYWGTESYNVWVTSGYRHYYTASRWINTSHWESLWRNVKTWVSANLTIYVRCSSYGWSVYSFASSRKRDCIINYKGNRYKAHKWVIDYRPARGGRVYAVRYRCYRKEVAVRRYYNVWVTSGYRQYYTASRWIDTSHRERRTRKIWVDTSYTVSQGYWNEHVDRIWVDTSHFENRAVWVEDGYYTSPISGEVTVEKNPGYIFTKWHQDYNGEECSMDLKVKWKLDNSKLLPGEDEKKISYIYIYEEVCRYKSRGIEKVTIFKGNIPPSSEGNLNTVTKFEHSGSEGSMLHIYLYGENGESAHIYFYNPINGYRSINIGLVGSSSDANTWLGGNSYGTIQF